MTLVWLSVSPAGAQEVVAPEYQVKAAFLYNFAKFTEWPTNAFAATNSPLVIGVLGQNPFGKILEETVKDKQIAGRSISVHRYRNPGEIGDCHMLFTTESAAGRLKELFAALGKRPVLTVGQSEGFARQGGIINFIKEDSHVRFEINATQAKEAMLKLSSRLLRLAVIVKPDGR